MEEDIFCKEKINTPEKEKIIHAVAEREGEDKLVVSVGEEKYEFALDSEVAPGRYKDLNDRGALDARVNKEDPDEGVRIVLGIVLKKSPRDIKIEYK